jgi:hypothetical protein
MGKRIFIVIVVLVMVALPMVVSAQSASRTFTITEAQINQSFRVTNPVRVRVSNMVVDLQPGQVSISYTYTVRAPRGSSTTSRSVNTIYVPNVTNGRLYWSVTSVIVNGQPASDDLVRQINASIESSWRNYIRRQLDTGRIGSITITNTEMTITTQ